MRGDEPSAETKQAMRFFENEFQTAINAGERRQSIKLMKQVFLQFDEVFQA